MNWRVILSASATLAGGANGFTVTLIAEGTVTLSSPSRFPDTQVGDQFRLVTTYSDEVADSNPADRLGVYTPSEFSMTLEIIDRGLVFQSSLGSISVTPRAQSPLEIIVPEIFISGAQPDGSNLFLFLQDEVGSLIQDDGLPASFGRASDYELAGISILVFFFIATSTPRVDLNGAVPSLTDPEPTTPVLLFTLVLMGLNRRVR